jgi:hypothetical protein
LRHCDIATLRHNDTTILQYYNFTTLSKVSIAACRLHLITLILLHYRSITASVANRHLHLLNNILFYHKAVIALVAAGRFHHIQLASKASHCFCCHWPILPILILSHPLRHLAKMCIKEFLGYNCGHCSVPVLRQCPLAGSNTNFPVCKFPAERPVFSNEFCHPCSRVVWNANVLKAEEEHRGQHMRGECGCEVVFKGDARDNAVVPCLSKGKGKGKEKGKGVHNENIFGPGLGQGVIVSGAAGAGHGGSVCGGGLGQGVVASGAVGVGGGDGFQHGIEEFTGTEIVLADESLIRQQWDHEAQLAAYNYVGYRHGFNEVPIADPGQSFATPSGGYDTSTGQLMAGQFGAGMKWYPHEIPSFQAAGNTGSASSLGTTFIAQPYLQPQGTFQMGTQGYRDGVEESFARYGVETDLVAQPPVVKSEMARPEST